MGPWHRDSQFTHRDIEAEKEVLAAQGAEGHSVQLQIALAPSDDVEVVPGSHLRWDTPEESAIRHGDDKKNNRSSAMPRALRVALEPGDGGAASSGGRQIVRVRLKQHALGIPQEESYEDLCRVEALEEAELVQVLQPVLLEPQIRGDPIPRVI